MKTMRNQRLKQIQRSFWRLSLILLIASAIPSMVLAQDAVFKVRTARGSSKVSGKITEVSAEGVTIDGELVPAADIKKVVFSKEPTELDRARDQMESGRYADAIEELEKIKSPVGSAMVQQEIDFIKAYSTSRISLLGGNITPQVAGKEIGKFITTYKDASYHLAPAIEQYGKLIYAFGKPEVAVREFNRLTQSSWPEYQLRGHFQLGKTLTELGRYDEAELSFDAILAEESNDDVTQTYKLLATCEKARLAGIQGNLEAAKKVLEGIIRDENPDKKRLFAHLYNALGATYEQAGKLKEAATAYLHTELLFASESEPHSEALYRLALIWPKLEQTDRANRARDTLKSRYRNSYWAGKL